MARLFLVFSLLGCFAVAPAPFSSSWAAEPITLSLGGRLREYFYVADQKSAPPEQLSHTGMINDVRIAFQGRTVLDNGITVRAFARIYVAGQFDRTFDEAFGEVNTGVGKFRMGETEGVNARILGDPVPEALLSRDEEVLAQALKPRTGITVFDAFSFRRFTGNGPSVAYESPEIAGFKAGVAFHPQVRSRPGQTQILPAPGTGPIDQRLNATNGVDVSAAYSGSYPGGNYHVGFGYFHSQPGIPQGGFPAPEGDTAVNMVAGLSYGNLELSGGYIDVSPSTGLDEQSWTIGALYAIGPFRLSANYMRGDRETVRNGTRRERLDRETIQGSYKLAPNVTLGLAGFRAGQTDAAGLSWDSTGFLSGIKLGF